MTKGSWHGAYYKWHPTKENQRTHSNELYQKIHDDLYAKYKNEIEVKSDEEDAKIIEDFLFALKVNIALGKEEFKDSKKNLNEELEKLTSYGIWNEIFNEIKNLEDFKNKFYFSVSDNTGGAAFEEIFGELQAFLANRSKEDIKEVGNIIKEYVAEDFLTGKNQAGYKGAKRNGTLVINQQWLLEDSKKIFKKENENDGNIAKQLQKSIFKIKDNKELKSIKGKEKKSYKAQSQKVDNRGLGMSITAKATLTERAHRAMQLIYNKNFSLKNYKTDRTPKIDTGIPFTAIYSVIASLAKVDKEETMHIIAQGLHASSKNIKAVINYMIRLRLLYAYTGLGQLEVKGVGKDAIMGTNNNIVDFIVVNDPDSTDIQVFSVKKIMYDTLSNKNFKDTTALMKEIYHNRASLSEKHRTALQ